MKCLLSLIIVFSTLFSFAQTKPESIIKKYPNGKLMYKGTFLNNKPVGELLRYYKNGSIKAKMFYSGEYVEAKLYNNRAVLTAVGRFHNCEKDSLWSYYRKGQVISQDLYDDGHKNGICKLYFLTGELKEECCWQNDKKSGVWRRFDRYGVKLFEGHYIDSELNGKFVTYRGSGKINSVGNFVDSAKDGKWTYYDNTGRVRLIVLYKDGEPNKDLSEKNVNYLRAKMESERKYTDPEEYMDYPEEYIMKELHGRGRR
ncbi:MAG: hypothetical protein WBG43_02920 [Marinifilaceae bacterium]